MSTPVDVFSAISCFSGVRLAAEPYLLRKLSLVLVLPAWIGVMFSDRQAELDQVETVLDAVLAVSATPLVVVDAERRVRALSRAAVTLIVKVRSRPRIRVTSRAVSPGAPQLDSGSSRTNPGQNFDQFAVSVMKANP